MIRPVQTRFEAAWYDGQSAVRRTAAVEVGLTGLTVTRDGAFPAAWSMQSVRIAEDGSYGEPVRLEHESGESLTIDSPDFMEALRQHGLAKPESALALRGWPQVILCSIAIAAIGGAMYWWGLAWAASEAARFMPAAMEERLGRATIAILAPEEARCNDAVAQARLKPLIDRLSAAAGRKFTILFVDQGVVNAFAAPGGYIVVFRGLLDQTGTAEEFTGVLAHEMEHVILKHSTRALARHFSGRALLSLMSVDSSGTPAAIQGAALLASLSYQREDEESADLAALGLLARAHISTGGLASFLGRISTLGVGGAAMKYLSTHPAMIERVAALKAEAKKLDSSAPPLMTADEWQRARRACGGE